MAGAKAKLQTELAGVKIVAPRVPVVSNVTARAHGAPDEIATLLVEQVCSPVRWEESMRALLAQGFTRFIELGPSAALTGFMKRIDKTVQVLNVGDTASLEATAKALGG
jgi:[acyl-carrier-protein] S-malonyltransferase